MLKEYIINRKTLLLKGVVIDGKLRSYVKEVDGEFYVMKRPTAIVKESCKSYGSNFDARVKQSKETIDIKQFVPIVIDDRSNIILFPDSSPHNHDVVWYSALMIDTFINDDDDEFVMFRNRELFHISQNYDAAKKRFSFSLHLNHRLKNEQLMF